MEMYFIPLRSASYQVMSLFRFIRDVYLFRLIKVVLGGSHHCKFLVFPFGINTQIVRRNLETIGIFYLSNIH